MQDEVFCACRFSLISDGNYILFIAGNYSVWKKQFICFLENCSLSTYVFHELTVSTSVLYNTDKSGSIVTWNTTTWKRIGSKTIARDIICAFDVSADGKLLAW